MGSLLENLKGGRTSKPSSRGTARGSSRGSKVTSRKAIKKRGRGGR
tara:strand:- start:86 stop:223 length:138 start_codon:yes stop_codon:yes gene_type:complete